MKKFIIAILSLLYIGTSTGATIRMHYCMGQFSDWGVGHDESKTCGKCGMDKSEKKDDCCKDDIKILKNAQDQKASSADFQFIKLLGSAVPVSFIEIPAISITSITEANPVSNAPPGSSGHDIYIRNCVFLI